MNTDPTKSALTPPLQESESNRSFGFSDLFKFLYNANPFYLISACLILYAQTVIFDTGNIWMETAIPLGLIASYTVLLTATAIFIVRKGSVWDDARSILLIILSLFVVLSASIDAKTLDSPVTGAAWLGGGLCFSIVIAESLRKGLRLSLPLIFRAVFYTMIGIFFAYPFVMAQLVNDSSNSQLLTIRGIMLFPIVFGLALMPLIPVIRRGPSYLAANGTPWQWPMFPWSIFGLLTIGACCRTYLLSLSFYGGRGYGPFSHMETGFSLYMLIPLALASMILLLEFALERGGPRQIALCLVAPFLFLLMALPGPTKMNVELYHKFLAAVVGSNGSPMLIALAGMLVFYVYAWYRSVKHSETILCGVLLLSQALDVQSHWLSMSHISTWIPGVAALAILAWIAVRKNSTASWMALVLGVLLVTGTEFRDSQFTAWHGAIPVHIALAAAILLGVLRDDLFAVVLRYISAAVMTLLFATVLFFGDELARGLPKYLLATYLAVLFAVLMWYCLWYRRVWFLVLGGFNAIMLLLFTTGKAYNTIKAMGFKALNIIFWGMVCFAIAFFISALKGNLFQAAFLKLKSRWGDKG
jgi:hypothetical protein